MTLRPGGSYPQARRNYATDRRQGRMFITESSQQPFLYDTVFNNSRQYLAARRAYVESRREIREEAILARAAARGG